MDEAYNEFSALLEQENKADCVEWALAKVTNHELEIDQLYSEILARALNSLACEDDNKWTCVWREHVKTGIVRTIVECCYPQVLAARDSRYGGGAGEKVVVLCPTDEYHDLGARMVADFFAIAGFESIFIGSNTPEQAFFSAIELEQPKYVAISVSNPYHLFVTQKIIQKIRVQKNNPIIIVGGLAFQKDPDTYQEVGADLFLNSFADICNLNEGA